MAIANETYWEVRGGAGSDTNGGGFAGNGDLSTLAAPTVTGSSTGGTVAAGTYYTVVSYMFYNAYLSFRGPKSATTATTVTGSTSTLTVTSPVAHPAANFYNVYMSTSANGPFYLQSSNVAIGTNYVRTTSPASSGQQPLGVDYSQQNAAQVNIDNSAITTSVTTTVITFTAGYTPTAADVGNQLYIASGTNITAGFWQITGWTATTWTVDRNIPSAGTTVNMIAKMGGALNTISAANAAVPASSANIINIKSGAYAETITTLVGGGNKNPFTFRGYGSARGDNPTGTSRPLIDGGSVRANCAVLGNSNVLFENLRFANSTSHAISSTAGRHYFHNCKFSSAGGDGISSTAGLLCSNCESSANVGSGFTGANYNNVTYMFCNAHDNGSRGFNGGTQIAFMSVADSNVSHGFRGATSCYWVNCTAYGSASGSGIFPGVGSSGVCQIVNCVATGNNQFGFTDTTAASYAILRNCYSYGNATGPYENVSSPPVTDVDPQIVDAPNADFRVGANMKGAGLSVGTSVGLAADGSVDVGAVQRVEDPSVDATAPAAPTLSLVSVASGAVTLLYTPPGGDYTSGEIEYDSGGGVTAYAVTTAGNKTVTGLTDGLTYVFTSRARDATGNWSERSVAIRAIPGDPESLVASVIAETIAQLETLNLGGVGVAGVFKGRRPKVGPQAKTISINVYAGDIDKDGRPGTTGYNYFGVPCHIHVVFKRQDKNTGESQTSLMGDYLFKIAEYLDGLRPAVLATPLENFFSTYTKIEDIDTETGSATSEAVGLDPTIEGYVTVVWEFWRPQP